MAVQVSTKFKHNASECKRCIRDNSYLTALYENGTQHLNFLTCYVSIDPSLTTSPQTEELFDLIASSQSRRLDDQRVSVSNLPGLRITHNNLGHLCGEADAQEPSDDFFNMLIKCQVNVTALPLEPHCRSDIPERG